jgi:hypothetical protein
MAKAAPPGGEERVGPKGLGPPKVPPAPPPHAELRRSWLTLPLAQLVPAITRPAFKKRSPAGATLMADWAAIIGPQLAAVTEPRRLTRGQLTIACAGPVAMELQHLQGVLIERINAHAGGTVVETLRFVQDHITPRPLPVAVPPRGAPEKIAELPDGPLADALAGLRQAIRARA